MKHTRKSELKRLAPPRLMRCGWLMVTVLAGCSANDPAPSPQAAGSAAAGAPVTAGGMTTTSGGAGTPSVSSGGNGGAAGAGMSGVIGGTPTGGSGGMLAASAGAAAGTGGASGGGAGAGGGVSSGGQPGTLEATMVVRGAGTATAGDQIMIGRLEAFGFSKVKVVSDAAVTADSVTGQALVVISSSAESGPLKDKLKNIALPVLCVEDAEFKLMGMASAGDHDSGTTQLQILTGASALVGAASGSVTFTTSPGELGWGTPAPAALKGATMIGNPEHVVIFGYEKGAQMASMVAPARRAGFAIREGLAANLNEDGVALFDAVVSWVMQ